MAERSSTQAGSRRAGFAYLAVFVFSASAYITLSKLLAADSHTVLARLATNQALFTLAFAASVIGFAAWVVLAVLLYRLMSSAGRLSGQQHRISAVTAGVVANNFSG